ncbi:MAG: NADAR family protein [Dyadobacter sp.]|uniref:NADAR family protein n=1 Tax=Dyadobacter sp. TaxID=1914288 RepID=UPI001B1C1E7A|nr:NADAR family protein [Dyadobacter sp.]MBO9611475.1 NADAR family protein [Dyadobacter sp.]
MKYDLDWLIIKYEEQRKMKFLHFWGHQPARGGQITQSCLSQWWQSAFVIGDVTYRTSEHWMMAEKARLFENEPLRERIIACASPGEAKALGRMVENFDEQTWITKRREIVLEGSIQKFSQNPELGSYLLNTSDRILVEASPVDPVWGIGLPADDPRAHDPTRWEGLNLLGFTLMETRDLLTNR